MRIVFYALTAGIAAVVSLTLSIVIWKLSVRFRLYPKVRERDVHTRPTPRLGGVAMFFGVVVAFAVASQLPAFDFEFDFEFSVTDIDLSLPAPALIKKHRRWSSGSELTLLPSLPPTPNLERLLAVEQRPTSQQPSSVAGAATRAMPLAM